MHTSRQINENDTGGHSQFCPCFFIYLHQEFLSSKSYFSGFCWLASPRLPADLASVSPKFPPLQTALILSIYSAFSFFLFHGQYQSSRTFQWGKFLVSFAWASFRFQFSRVSYRFFFILKSIVPSCSLLVWLSRLDGGEPRLTVILIKTGRNQHKAHEHHHNCHHHPHRHPHHRYRQEHDQCDSH